MSDRTISFLVDTQVAALKGARSPAEEFLLSKSRRAIDVGVDALRAQIQSTLGTLLELLATMDLDEQRFQVGSVALTLSVNAEGKISILSIASGAVGSEAGLTFTLVRTGRTANG